MTDRSDTADQRPWTLSISDSWGRATSVDLADGDYVVGPDADCDIIVPAAGPDEAFTLGLDGHTIQVTPKAAEAAEDAAANAADGPTTYIGRADIRRPNLRIEVTHSSAKPGVGAGGPDAAPGTGSIEPAMAAAIDDRTVRRALAAGGVLLLIGGLLLTLAIGGGDTRRQEIVQAAAEQQHAVLADALAARGLDTHTQLRSETAGSWTVTRPLWRRHDIEALEALAQDNQLTLRFKGHQFERVRKSITDMAEGLGVVVKVDADASGTVSVAGVVATDAQRMKIRNLLGEDLAGTVTYRVGDVATVKEAAQELMRGVMQSDLYEEVVVEPGDQGIVVHAEQATADRPEMRELVADFQAKYGERSLTVQTDVHLLAARPSVGIWDGNIQYMFVNEHEVFLGDIPNPSRRDGGSPSRRKAITPALAN